MEKKIKRYKITESQYNRLIKEGREDRRFRSSIYVDVFVPQSDDLEYDREVAKQQVEEIQENIPNSYIGGIAYLPTGQIPDTKELDRLE